MTIYNLDQTPNTFIAAVADEGSYIYRMYSFLGDSSKSLIRDIDLRKDKLIIYGTEIKESIREKLHMSLLLRSGSGRIYVDCNGACYILVGSTFYRPIQNVIFDWSMYGVNVPNSVNDVLRKQQQQHDDKLAAMSSELSSAKGEASANLDGWEASKQEIEKLTSQLSACRKEQFDKELELQKVRGQISVMEFELNATKNQSELLKKEVMDLQEQVSDSKKDYINMEMELQMVKHQFVKCTKENEGMKVKLQSMQDVSSVVSELQSIKIELESSNKNMKELESQLLSRRKENQDDIVTELQNVQNEPSSSNLELQLTKSRLESSYNKIIELEEQLSTCVKVQDQLCMIMNELQFIKIMVDPTAKKEFNLDDVSPEKCYVIKAIEIFDDQSKHSHKDME